MEERGVRSRRQFTVEMAMALLGGAAVTIGCGGGGASPTAPGPASTPFPFPTATPPPPGMGTVGANHGHEAVITAAQLLAGGALRLDITGSAPHTHVVDLIADDVARVRNGERIVVNSSEDLGLFGMHRHVVQFN